MIRVLILAGNEAEETALATFVAEDDRMEIVDSAPDVVLLSSGRRGPGDFAMAPAVVLTDDVFEPSDYRTTVRARLPANATAAEVLAAIGAAAHGLVVLTQGQADSLFAHPPVAQTPPASLIEELTPRELQVLRDVARGLGNKEIGERLHISEHTVKFHVASILGKMQAGSRTEAVTLGIRMGLIPI